MKDDHKISADGELIQRIFRGDESAMEALINAYWPLVFSIARSRLHNNLELAEELSQDVFLRAHFNLNGLNDPAKLPAWLARITRNLASDWNRRELRRSALVQLVDSEVKSMSTIRDESVDAREVIAARESHHQLDAALKKLSPTERELLFMHYGEEMTLSDIARGLDKNVSTVKRQLDRIVGKLRDFHKQEWPAAINERQRKAQNASRIMAMISSIAALPVSQRSALADFVANSNPAVSSAPPRSMAWPKIGAIAAMGLSTVIVTMISLNRFDADAKTEDSTQVAVRSDNHASTGSKPRNQVLPASMEDVVSTSSLPMKSSAMPNSVATENQNSCPSLPQCIEALRAYESGLTNCQYTYVMNYTVIANNPLLDANDIKVDTRIGTVTLSGKSYLIESTVVSDKQPSGELITTFAWDGVQEYPVLINRNSIGETATLEKSHNFSRLRHYAPMYGMQGAIYGDGLLSDFLESEIASNAEIDIHCQVSKERYNVVRLSGPDWMIELSKDKHLMPIRTLYGATTRGQLKGQRECLSYAEINKIPYPALFNKRTFGRDLNGNSMILQETTASITMISQGKAEPISKEKFDGMYSKAQPETTSSIQTDESIQRSAEHRAGIEAILKRRISD